MENSIIDLVIRIKNGYLARKDSIESPYSKFKEEILKKLVELKFIKDYSLDKENFNKMTITLLYDHNVPAMTDVKIFSKPGSRHYISYRDLKPVMSGYGYSILSTPKGIVSNKEARVKKLGGELLFSIW